MESTLYRVLWGALGDTEKAAIQDLAGSTTALPSQALIDSIREAEQCLDIGGLPVAEVLIIASPPYDPTIDGAFLEWVRSQQM
jgi:hypothetical protein